MEKLSLLTTLRLTSSQTGCAVNTVETGRGTRVPPLIQHTKVLCKRYDIDISKLERLILYVSTPWRHPPEIHIDNTLEEGISQYAGICARAVVTCVYTDGSCVDGKLGAAAVILSNPSSDPSPILHERSHHLGSDAQTTIYVAELNGILPGP